MNIKECLKMNKTICSIGKKVNIRRQHMQDANDFSKYFTESAVRKGDYRYSIMLLVHSIEKGMCFPNPRPFGKDKVRELMQMLEDFPKQNRKKFEFRLGIAALYAWSEFYASQNWQNENPYSEVTAFLQDKTKEIGLIAGSKEYVPETVQASERHVFEKVILSRHSVRAFQKKKLDMADVQLALRCFVETPTACNRQMCRVYYVESQRIIDLLNNVLIGLPGFDKETVQYFVITYDLAAFAYSGERHQGLFNAGLCAMNFVNGLHANGIGSCCLQWSNKYDQDSTVRIAMHLRESERIAIVIGAGYYLEKNIIPCSARRKISDIFKII